MKPFNLDDKKLNASKKEYVAKNHWSISMYRVEKEEAEKALEQRLEEEAKEREER